MATSFCTNCGKPTSEGARFCIYCGTTVAAAAVEQPRSAIPAASIPMTSGLGLRSQPVARKPAAQAEDDTPWGLSSNTLNWMVGASFMNSLCNTEFLLVEGSQGGADFVPLSMITSMQGLKAVGCGSVSFYMSQDHAQISMRNFARGDVIREAASAFLEAEKKTKLIIIIFPEFQPMDYGELGPQITGQWATCVDGNGTSDIRTIMALPFSGLTIKQRLREHAAFIEEVISKVDDQAVKKNLAEFVANIRAAEKKIPDSFADHIYCIAYVMENLQVASTVLHDKREPSRKGMAAQEGVRRMMAFPAGPAAASRPAAAKRPAGTRLSPLPPRQGVRTLGG